MLDLNIADGIHAIYVRSKLKGPAVPGNPIAHLIADSPDPATSPSRKAALSVMRSARLRARKSLISRGVIA